MKKVLLFVLIVLLAILPVGSTLSFAEEALQAAVSPMAINENAEIEQFVQELCERNALGDNAAKDYLMEKFSEVLGEENVEEEMFFYDKNYCNIVAKLLKPGATKQIIIGAHYDVTRGEGAADNATGVAALYLTMKTLAANASKIPFNITFIAFDGEEQGLLGSDFHVNGYANNTHDGMSAEEIANTLVMFNIDSIAIGDNLYLMCENRHTNLADAILANGGIVEKPYARGTYGAYLGGFGYGYYEYVQGSDHTPFRLSGIPIAFLFSGTYSASPWGFSESSDPSKNVINSSKDTYENLVNNGVDNYVSRIETVSNAISKTILDDNFATVAENARNQLVNLSFWYNSLWPSITIAVILVILAVVTFLYYRKLQKKAILGTADIKTQKVFDKPDASEIFSFDKTKSDKSDVDDVFTFKK